MDRFFDNYISTPQQKFVFDALRPAERDPHGVEEAQTMLENAYAWLDESCAGADGPPATLSPSPTAPRGRSCSMPTGRIPSPRFANVHAYRPPARAALVRPRRRRGAAVPQLFPLGAPDRD